MNRTDFPIVFDAHCHIYPDKIAEKAAIAIGRFYDMAMYTDGSVATLLKNGEKAGITHFLVHSVATNPAQVQSINSFLSQTVEQYPDRFVGFGSLHPHSENLEEDIAHICELGLHGVKLHPDVQGFAIDSPEAIDMCSRFAGKLPLLVHAGDKRFDFSHPAQILTLCKALPNLTVIAAHFGGWSEWDEAADLLPGLPNLYVDTCSSLYALKPERAAELVRTFGADRVLFGVDFPMWDPSEELDRFFALPLTDEEREKILYQNAFDLLGLDESHFLAKADPVPEDGEEEVL
ncbi:MAG: amidohydrolase [Ruminococcaceae bacterium]|nr:amidohydrolase [Oscillospiraceae bacterium]